MANTRQILRSVQRLSLLSKSGCKHLKHPARRASTLTEVKVVEGENGERILLSPYGEPTLSKLLVHEFVWNKFNNYADKIALECGVSGRKYTYSQGRDAANYIARSLVNMRLKGGDVVALIAPNYPEAILSFLGALEAGLVVTTVNPFYTAGEISRQLESSGAKAVITVGEVAKTVLEAARTVLPSGAPFIVIEDGVGSVPDGTIPLKDLISRGKSLEPVDLRNVSNENLAVLPYSSGTTGLPKGVMLTHKNLVNNIEMTNHSLPNMFQTASDSFQEVLPVILPFYHIFGMNGVVLPRLAEGSHLITLPKFTPEGFANVLESCNATGFFCVPPIVLFLSMSELIKKSHMNNVHTIISGAAPLSQMDVERFYDKFGLDSSRLKFCQGYGLTETSPVTFFEKSGSKFSSIGKQVAAVEIRLVDPITKEDVSSVGQTGEIWVRGPHVMKGYLNNETATRETIVDGGWLKTGDIAYHDEEYDFFITDRLKELIKVKGYQVPPAELEALLRTHPNVQEAAVIGIPHERYGEVPKAFIMLKKDAKSNPEDISNFLKGKVSEYKELKGGVTFVPSIPKNPSGKILRSQLKAEYVTKK